MKQRILTGLGLIAGLILIFFSKSITTYVFDAAIVLIAIYAGYEMFLMDSKAGASIFFGMLRNKYLMQMPPVSRLPCGGAFGLTALRGEGKERAT